MGYKKGYTIFRRGGKGPWYVAWRDGTGKRQVKRASAIKGVANEIGRKMASESDRMRLGVINASETNAKAAGEQAITLHLKQWTRELRSRNNTAKHISITINRVARLCVDGRIRILSDLSAATASDGLQKITDRHTAQTAKHYFTAIRSFARWSVKTGRCIVSPILALNAPKSAGKTFVRMAMSHEQIQALVAMTPSRKCKSPFKGEDRAMYYLTMAYTGFRRSETASLTKESYKVLGNHSVTVQAAYSKRRREDTIPIRPDVAAKFAAWLESKPAGKRLFHITKRTNLERLFIRDCAHAGIVATEDRRLGIHCLRRYFITCVVRAGGLAVGQDLARHSTPALTKEYTDLDMRDYDKGLSGLPAMEDQEKKADQRRKIG